jgi:flagellar hook assembly protein FlgD
VPNPFDRAGGTTIRYTLPRAVEVKIRIYDAAGRLIRVWERRGEPGRNTVEWKGADQSGRPCASGVYFYEIGARDIRAMKRMLLVR